MSGSIYMKSIKIFLVIFLLLSVNSIYAGLYVNNRNLSKLDNIKYLETAILEKIDPATKLALSDSEVEILRTKRNLNIDLRDTPANYSKVVRDSGEVPVEYDPYFKTIAEVEKARKASGTAGKFFDN